MAQYEKVFTKPYEDGYVDLPNQTTPITAETLNDKDAAIEHIENFLDGHEFPTALADLSDDETHRLVTDTEIAEWNNKIDSTAVEEQTTTTGQFTTKTGGKLESCIVAFNPVQSGSGDPSPDNVRPITGHSSVEVTVSDAEDTVIEDVTVALGGTYYGGTLDVVSGKLTIDKGNVDLGDLSWTYYTGETNPIFQASVTGAKIYTESVMPNALSECYVARVTASRSNFASNANNGEFSFQNNYVTLLIRNISYSDADVFKTAMTGVKLVYELATPQTIQLTPTQINTLIGENHLDIPLEGQSLESLTYRELFAWDDVNDVVKAVDDKNADVSAIGTDESGRTTASRQYTYGERFYKDGKFCRTKTGVAQGATWVLNSNYEEGTIADWLQYYATQVTPSAGVTFDRNHVSVFGKMVNVYLKMTTFADSSTFAHQLGNLSSLRPAAEYAFLTIASAADPYDTLGHVFITGSDGRVGMPRGLPDSTNVFIHGTYITKD